MTREGRRRLPRPLRGARNLAYRVAVLVTQMERLEDAFRGLQDQQQDLLERVRHDHDDLLARIAANQEKTLNVLEVLRDAEPATRRLLWAAREQPSYEAAFTEPEPLVTVPIATYTNLNLLLERALPSVFAQTYERLEIVIVGDGASPEVERALRRVGDSRVRYTNLPYRGPYPEDPHLRWLVAGGPPINEAWRLATGRWLAKIDDDDAWTTNHVELLLKAARDQRWEFCYGRLRMHNPNGTNQIIGEFPPYRPGTLGWSASIMHAHLRFFTDELSDALFESVGDWARVNRMMRVGVRMGMIPDVVYDYYPNRDFGAGE